MIEEMRMLIARHAGRGATGIDGLHLSAVEQSTEPRSSIASPMLAMIAQGTKRIVFDDRTYDYGAGDYLVVSIDLPVTGHFIDASRERPCLGVGLDLRAETIASLVLANPTAGAVPSGRAGSPIAVNRASAELLDAVVRMLRLLDHPKDAPVLAPMIEREIIWRLLTGEQGAVVRQIGLTNGGFSQIGRAIRWIREHPAEPFRVEELAERASMSLSTFHRRFREITTTSPLQFQKKVRLQQARLLLIGQEQDVSGAAFAVGYDSPSQFIREYRREFGSPPGRDTARLRVNAMPHAAPALP